MKFKIIGDNHLTDRYNFMPFNGHKKLWNHIYEPDSILIQSGDLFDKAILDIDNILDPTIDFLRSWKHFYGIEGNHDREKLGSFHTILNKFDNVTTFKTWKVVDIAGTSWLMLPFLKDNPDLMKEYDDVIEQHRGKVDFTLAHLHPPGKNGGIEEIDLTGVSRIASFHGHLHDPYNYGKNCYSIGVPQTTREGEQDWKKRYFEFDTDNKKLTEKELPVFYTIKTIEYGEDIEDTDNLYNIVNAPSKRYTKDKYKGKIIIRDNGIKLEEREVEKKIEYKQGDKKITVLSDWRNENFGFRPEVKDKIEYYISKQSSSINT